MANPAENPLSGMINIENRRTFFSEYHIHQMLLMAMAEWFKPSDSCR